MSEAKMTDPFSICHLFYSSYRNIIATTPTILCLWQEMTQLYLIEDVRTYIIYHFYRTHIKAKIESCKIRCVYHDNTQDNMIKRNKTIDLLNDGMELDTRPGLCNTRIIVFVALLEDMLKVPFKIMFD